MVIFDQAAEALHRLDRYVAEQNYEGPDPYDGLASSIGRKLPSARLRQAWIQVIARTPLNLRTPLRVPRMRMVKALALFVSGLQRVPDLPNARSRVDRLIRELEEQRKDPGGWGYEFDVQTRWAYYSAGSPNIIVTSFVLEALRDAGHLPIDRSLAEWFEAEMIHPDGFVRYIPRDDHLIHNANLLGARALSRIAPAHPAVRAAVHRSLEHQRRDGAWPYGESENLGWVDNFHTAYVLFALADLEKECPEIEPYLNLGLESWTTRCFDSEGRARYFADKEGPVDVHNVASAVYALVALRPRYAPCGDLIEGALSQLLQMQRRDGAFVARREPAYMRWNQAHAFRALAEVVASGPPKALSHLRKAELGIEK